MESKEVLTQEGTVSVPEVSAPRMHADPETDQEMSPTAEHGGKPCPSSPHLCTFHANIYIGSYRLNDEYYFSFLLGSEESATLISSQSLPEKESNATSTREAIDLNEETSFDSSATIQCRTSKDLKEILNSATKHMQQNQDTHQKDCFSIQGQETSDQDANSLAMTAFAFCKAIQGNAKINTGKFLGI